VVPIEGDPNLDSISEGSAATFFGTLERGHAIAVAIGEDLYFPRAAAVRPGPLVPRLRVAEPASVWRALFAYLWDPRYWKEHSVLPTCAVAAAITAAVELSLLALVVCVVTTCWFVVLFRRWRSTVDPFDDRVGPVEFM